MRTFKEGSVELPDPAETDPLSSCYSLRSGLASSCMPLLLLFPDT